MVKEALENQIEKKSFWFMTKSNEINITIINNYHLNTTSTLKEDNFIVGIILAGKAITQEQSFYLY